MAKDADEAVPLIEGILARHGMQPSTNEQWLAGKHIVQLRAAYLRGEETIESLDRNLTIINNVVGHPAWLAMLSRNCEYATDIPDFRPPFEQEFAYIAALWASASAREDFDAAYRREISNTHDIDYHQRIR